tara:strand:- start:6266 stop:6568 length:303 start_codon:yes stop_codon:yes gene_type:complete
MVKTHCETILGYDELGEPKLKKKLKYDTHDKAVKACKKLNLKEGQIHKLVTYKCRICYKYHIGRNGKKITDKYANKLTKEKVRSSTPKGLSLKIIGKIDL